MAASNVVKTFRDSTIVLSDGTPTTPLTCTPKFYKGDFKADNLDGCTYDVVTGYYYTSIEIQAQGELVSMRKGERVFPSCTISCFVGDITEDDTEIINDFIHRIGAFEDAVATRGTNEEVFTFDTAFTIEGTDHGDATDKTITLEDCKPTTSFEESMEGDSLSLTFSVLGGVFFA